MVAIAYVLRTATAGVRPEFEHERTRERRAVLAPEGALSHRAYDINQRPLRRFVLSWSKASDGQRLLVTQAWNASLGCTLLMSYVPLRESNALTVRFVPGSLTMRRKSPRGTRGEHEISVEIEERR